MQTKDEKRQELEQTLKSLDREYDELNKKALQAKGDVAEATADKMRELRERRENIRKTLKDPFPRPRR